MKKLLCLLAIVMLCGTPLIMGCGGDRQGSSAPPVNEPERDDRGRVTE